jgi:hypothetical protein
MCRPVPSDEKSEDRAQDEHKRHDRPNHGDHVQQEAERLVLAAQRVQHDCGDFTESL